MRRALAIFGLLAALVVPAAAQNRAGPGPAPGPWQQAYPDLYYNYGGIRLPFTVPGGSKGPGTINAAGLYLNGVLITSVPVSAANMPAFTGDCASAAGTTSLTCTKTQGTPYAPSATTDATNANNIGSGTLPAARLPAPTATTRGGILAATAPANQFQTGTTADTPTFAQPAFANLSGVLLSTQVPAFTGDFTCSGLTCSLASVNASPGSYGGASSVPTFTVNAKGLLTAAGAAAVVAPAGTLSGTTLAANVVNTSITSVGTIVTGVWNGTAINPAFIATGTSGASIGLLNANKTDSGSNTYTGSNTFSGANSFTGGSIAVPTPAAGDNSTKAASTAHVAANYAGLAVANVFTAKQTMPASTTGAAAINLPHGTAPTTPVNGDCWTTTLGLYCRINGSTIGPYAPPAGAATQPQFTEYLSGSGTYTTPAGATRLEIEGIGGGKGGNGNGGPGNGGDTTFGPITAPGGGSATTQAQGAAIGSFFASAQGALGGVATSSFAQPAGTGGGGMYGGAGVGGQGSSGFPAAANTGAGGGGAGTAGVNGAQGGTGGPSGVGFKMIINSPAASYSYAVGAGSIGGASGGNLNAGGNGAAGRIRVTAYFN